VTITAAKVTDKVITKDNFENNAGFTVKAKDPYGNDAKISTHTGPAGFGVESLAETNSGKLGQTDQVYSGHTSEIGVVKDGSTYKSESIEVEFKNPVHTLDVAFAWRHNGETAKVDFYNGNEKVGYAIVSGGGSNTDAIIRYYDKNGNLKDTVNAQGGTDNVDLVYTFKPAGDVTFTKAVFSADGAGSDYLIHSISYKEVSEGDSTTIVGSDEVAFKISTSNIPDSSKYDFINTFPTADVKIVDKNSGEVLFEKTVNLDKDGKAIVTVRTDGTKDLKAEVSNVQGNFEEVDYTNAKTEVEASIKATASNDSFNTFEDTNYVLKTTDFGDNNQNVAKIKFDSVPVNGTIYVLKSEYTGSMNDRAEYTSSENKVYIEVKAGDIVDISKIENGNVVFVPENNTDSDSSFKFSVSNGNGNFSGNYTTDIIVKAVADAPTVSIDITKIGATTIVVDGNGNESSSSGIKSLDILKVNPNYNGQETIDKDYSYSGNDNITKNYQNLNSGATNITTDKGNDTLEFQSLDSKNINSGAGNDTVIVNQSASSSNIQLGEGNNIYTVAGSLNSGTTQSGAGNDTVIVNQGASNTVINLGDGNNKISIGEALNNSNISTGNGNDTLIVGQASDNNTISTGGGNDFVQLNHNVQGTKIDLGTGNDGIRLSNEGHVNFNTETLIDGGVDFDTLYLNGKETDYWIEDANHNKITYSQYVQENKDINGYANKLFYIYEVDGNGTKQGSGFKIKNIEDIVFEKDLPKEVIIKAVEYKVDISAALTDTDGSETLSVVIKNVPTGAVLESTKYDVSKNSDGSWSVNFKAGTTGDALLKIEDSLTMKVPQSYKGEINLQIEAKATETRDNEDEKNFKVATASDATVTTVDETSNITVNKGEKTNLVLTVDVSGSMAVYGDGAIIDKEKGITRLDVVKQSLISTIETYKAAGNTMVNITLFANGALNKGWMSADKAIEYIKSLSIDKNFNIYEGTTKIELKADSTDYAKALETTGKVNISGSGQADAKTVGYFISDGQPQTSSQQKAVDSDSDTAIVNWKKFIDKNNIDLKVIGVGTAENNADALKYLKSVQVMSHDEVIVINEPSSIETVMLSTVEGTVFGDVTDNFSGGDGKVTIDSIEIGNKIYTKDTMPIGGIKLDGEGKLLFDFTTGKYAYNGNGIDIKEDATKSFKVNVSDEDGDKDSINVNFELNKDQIKDGIINFKEDGDINFSNLKNITEINLDNGKENKLSLTLDDVLKMSGDNNTIKISKDKFDSVAFKNEDGKAWEKQASSIIENNKTFDVYTNSGDPTVQVKVEQPISDGITN
ncbi:hypothetical protein ACOTVK_10520, partial [Aliarcobacter butzleri]